MIADKGTTNIEAYDAFLKGWVHYLRMTPDDLAKAIRSFKRAIELDPNFGRAHAGMALAYWGGQNVVGLRKGLDVSLVEARLRVGQYVKQAMKNPTSIAHSVNGRLYLFRRQHEEAISEHSKALALDPNDPVCNRGMGSALILSGKPKEGFDFYKRAMRLDPQNPAADLMGLGMAQFAMGNLEEAVKWAEEKRRRTPEVKDWAPFLAFCYGLLGREKEAGEAQEIYRRAWTPGGPTLAEFMYFLPFRDREIADRAAEGMVKAGIKEASSGYFPTFKENQLTGEEIKKLVFGSKTTGIGFNGQQWWIEGKKNGEFIWRGDGAWRGGKGISADTGKGWIEGDMLCLQWQKNFGGLEYCATVFRNPRGTNEGKDEYVSCSDCGLSSWSVVR